MHPMDDVTLLCKPDSECWDACKKSVIAIWNQVLLESKHYRLTNMRPQLLILSELVP